MFDQNSLFTGFGTILVSILSSSIVSASITHWLGKRRDKEIELLKDSLAQGAYVGRAQFDLEVNAYKELWAAVSDLRLRARAFQLGNGASIDNNGEADTRWHREAFPRLITEFTSAHNTSLLTCDKFAPFYPEEIFRATLQIAVSDVALFNFLGQTRISPFSEQWYRDLSDKAAIVLTVTEQIEFAIRKRLASLRVSQ